MKACAALAVVLLCGCVCFPPEEQPINESVRAEGYYILAANGSVIFKSLTTSTTLGVKYITIQQPRYFNVTLDLRDDQRRAILNIRPKMCHTGACSMGFDDAKGQVINILGIPGTRYSERLSNNFYELYRDYNETWLPVKNDTFGEYVTLNASIWWIPTEGTNGTYNGSITIRRI